MGEAGRTCFTYIRDGMLRLLIMVLAYWGEGVLRWADFD